MITAAAIRRMADLGLTASDIADVCELMAPAKSSGAARQARYRERKAERVTSDVTRDVTPPSPSSETKGFPTPLPKTQPSSLTPTPPISPPAPVTDFDRFWTAYPRKVAKPDARKAFDRATKRATIGTMLDGVRRCAAVWETGEPQFIPHPATWLNRDGWLDELTPAVRPRSFLEIDRDRDDAQQRGALMALEIMKEKDRRNERPSENRQLDGPGPALPKIVSDGQGAGALVVRLSERLTGSLGRGG